MDKIKYVEKFFQDLKFDSKKHEYTVGKEILPSVSSLLKKFYATFNGSPTNTAIRLGISEEEVLQQWKDFCKKRCDIGTEAHLYAETKDEKINTEYKKSINDFFNCIPSHIVSFKKELRMYHKDLKFAGTCDDIYLNTKTNKFIITDYKTNLDLFKNYMGKTLLFPFDHLLDCPYSKYILQLSFYKELFEQTGFEVESLKIIWLKTDSYTVYEVTPINNILNYI